MLILTRREGESIFISPSDNLSPETTVAELFADGDIEIHIFNSHLTHASIGIQAPEKLTILGDELVG